MSKYVRIGLPAILVTAMVASAVLATVTGEGYGWLYLAVGALFLYLVRPSAAVHRLTTARFGKGKASCAALAALITIAALTLPMDDLPLWNGEQPDHRNQYEVMAESILDGHIDLYYDEEDTLANLQNPYDPDQREGYYYHWDHAYYEGHYYMYFGVVPVFLAFLPYRLLTGEALPTYQATQLFAAVFVAGVFMLFRLLAQRFFKKLPFGVYLALSVAVSAMSVWYASAEPALYCTAITAALALQIWSFYFFVRAVYVEERENRQILLAAVGALLGALVFGCRPPIALANLLVLPMLVAFLRQRKWSWRVAGKLVLAALPYVAVAAALMWYNYARFENPFEFGQAYQLTVADQTDYKVTLDKPTLFRLADNLISNYLWVGKVEEAFPYINTSGVLWNFPVVLLCVALFRAPSVKAMKKDTVLPLAWCLPLIVLVITAMDILWTPYLLERYNMDIYFLLGIALFLAVGYWYATCTEKQGRRLACFVMILSAATAVSSFLYYAHTVGAYYPEEVTAIAHAWHLL
ncbi:MAG: hypothetical protein IJN04_07550 [Clostridia bacterium]|nr:hypothetical protein [Clostridia bacterium]